MRALPAAVRSPGSRVPGRPGSPGRAGQTAVGAGRAFDGVKSRMLETYSPEEIEERVAKRLQDPDVAAWPNLFHVLNYPKNHEAWFDIVMNEVDGEWYEERNPVTLAPNIDIPVWLQIDQGRGWTMDGTIELYHALNGPKKLDIGPYPPMQSRPFVEEHDKMFRRYEYWPKGIDNGVMDEPSVSVHVEGSRETVTGAQWPPKDVEHRPLYLRPRRALSPEPEPTGAEYAAPDGFYQAPLTVTDKVEILSWSTAPFTEPTEMIGQGAAHLFAEIDQPDTATRITRTPGRCRSSRGGSRSTCCGSTRSARRSCRGTSWSWSCPTTSRRPTRTTRCCRRTPSTCRWGAPSRTGSTGTPRTRPGSCCRSRGPCRPPDTPPPHRPGDPCPQGGAVFRVCVRGQAGSRGTLSISRRV